MAHPNEEIVRQGYKAFGEGDMDTLRSIMTPDVVHAVPGNSQLSGEHRGIDAVLAYYQKLFELTGGTFKADLQSVKAEGGDKAVAAHHITARRDGKTYDRDETLTFTFAGGKVTRLVENHSDQAAYDAFWS
jgi:ketosteroid isomerase-like protein